MEDNEPVYHAMQVIFTWVELEWAFDGTPIEQMFYNTYLSSFWSSDIWSHCCCQTFPWRGGGAYHEHFIMLMLAIPPTSLFVWNFSQFGAHGYWSWDLWYIVRERLVKWGIYHEEDSFYYHVFPEAVWSTQICFNYDVFPEAVWHTQILYVLITMSFLKQYEALNLVCFNYHVFPEVLNLVCFN